MKRKDRAQFAGPSKPGQALRLLASLLLVVWFIAACGEDTGQPSSHGVTTTQQIEITVAASPAASPIASATPPVLPVNARVQTRDEAIKIAAFFVSGHEGQSPPVVRADLVTRAEERAARASYGVEPSVRDDPNQPVWLVELREAGFVIPGCAAPPDRCTVDHVLIVVDAITGLPGEWWGPGPMPPTAATPSPSPSANSAASRQNADCSVASIADFGRIASVEHLAWLSYQVIAGTVVAQLPPVWVEMDGPMGGIRRVIYTDTVIRVDQRVRGQAFDLIRVRQPGGTIGDCTQTYAPAHEFALGQQFVLFLSSPVSGAAAPTYFVTGGPQGYWPIGPDGVVLAGQYPEADGLPLADALAATRALLSGPEPTSPPWLARDHVPLPEAPVATDVP